MVAVCVYRSGLFADRYENAALDDVAGQSGDATQYAILPIAQQGATLSEKICR